MPGFQAQRITHHYTQTNIASPEKVFPLLCPVREAEWVPGWQYHLIYSSSGVAEAGCMFTTPNEGRSETTWIVTEYDPLAFRIAFVWVNPGLIATQLQIQLQPASDGLTSAHIQYTYTGLSAEGNKEVGRYNEAWFRDKMQGWETAINHYLRTGKCIEAGGWE